MEGARFRGAHWPAMSIFAPAESQPVTRSIFRPQTETHSVIEARQLQSLREENVRVIETDVTATNFLACHIPGALFWPIPDLLHPDFSLRRDATAFRELLERSGINEQTLVVVSYSREPGTAGFLFWILRSFGHTRLAFLNGGTAHWRAQGLPVSSMPSVVEPTPYGAPLEWSSQFEAKFEQLSASLSSAQLLDVRSEAEFRGEVFLTEPPQNGERAGCIRGANWLAHTQFLDENCVLKPKEEIAKLLAQAGLNAEQKTISYCAMGARSAFVWFVLHEVLGWPNMANYAGSWLEWSRRAADEWIERPEIMEVETPR